MTGRLPIADLTSADKANSRLYYFDGINNTWINNPQGNASERGATHIQVSMGYDAERYNYWGPDIECSRTISSLTNTNRHLLKMSWGGSAISTWHPDTGSNYAKIKSMCQSAGVNQNDNVTVFWMQGETDAQPHLCNDYYDSLKYLESRLKTDLFMDRFIVGRITTQPWATYSGSNPVKVVRSSLEQFEWVDTDSFSKVQEVADGNNPPAHYDGDGVRSLGRIFALKYLYGLMSRYRLLDPSNGQHYYTLDRLESISMQRQGWQLEDKQYMHYLPSESNKTTPLYRAFNPAKNEHFWTANKQEYDYIVEIGWIHDGIDGHIFINQEYGTTPLFRFYLGGHLHHYTADPNEKANLLASGWIYEGVVGYVVE